MEKYKKELMVNLYHNQRDCYSLEDEEEVKKKKRECDGWHYEKFFKNSVNQIRRQASILNEKRKRQ